MRSFFRRPLEAMTLGAFLAVATSAACGSSDATNPDYGQPPDPSKFNPGSSGGSDPYGGYGEGPGKLECPAELKRCAHTVTYPAGNEAAVELRGDYGGPGTWETGKPMTKKGSVWTVDILVPLDKPIQYKFVVDGTWKHDPAQPSVTDASGNTNNTFAGKTCEPAVCEEEGQLPPGVFDWRDSVMYFVFVDRFHSADPARCNVEGVSGPIANYQGGDWPGVTEKIKEGYFNDLGVNTLWITVPFDNVNISGKGAFDDKYYSGFHGYWPKIDSSDPTQLSHETCYGSFNNLKALIEAAHDKGLKVLFDFAMVHVHSQSKIFTDHPDWFWPNSNGPNNCVCGQGCDWNAHGERCWFTDYLPHWNYTNAAARNWSVTNAIAWITKTADKAGMGVDGFRADAIKHVDMSWLTELRARIKTEVTAKQNPPQRFYMVGETYEFNDGPGRDLLKKYVDPATKLDGQFDFPLRRYIVEATVLRSGKNMADLARFMDSNDYFYGANAVMSTFIGNHDLPRIIHLAANNPIWRSQEADGKDRAWANQPGAVTELEAFERVANGFAVLFTNRGAPLVYYGDEIGLPGAGDPDNRRFMQWSDLTPSQTFLRNRLKRLADIRSKHPALRRGTRATIHADADSWTFVRQTTGDTVYVAINRSDSAKQVSGLPSVQLEDLVSGQLAQGPTVSVSPRQTRIFVVK